MSKYEIYDVKIAGVFKTEHNDGFIVEWDSNMGFGQFEFLFNDKGAYINNELMSKEFIKAVMGKFIDDARLESDR